MTEMVSACCHAAYAKQEDREVTHDGAGERWAGSYLCEVCGQECGITVPGSQIEWLNYSGMTGEAMLDALDAAGSGWIREAVNGDG